jgi:hypothetical protein
MLKALFFSPYADIWVHSLPEAEIAEALHDDGWEISRITCDRDFSEHCVSMAARELTSPMISIQRMPCVQAAYTDNLSYGSHLDLKIELSDL